MIMGHILTRDALMFVDFLNRYRAKSTRSMYGSAWIKFLSLVYGARLKGASPALLDPWVAKYVNDLRNGRRDLAADLRALEAACRSRRTCLGYRSAIRTLLAEAGIALPPGDARRLPRARGSHRPPAAVDSLTPGKLLRLMEHLDTRGRAIVYTLVSSGAHLGEVLSIRLGDLDLDARPARFLIRTGKTEAPTVAFISREAVGAIRVYLIVRDRFLASARARGGTAGEDLLFPIGPRAFEQVWDLALSKAGLERVDRVTGRRTLTLRSARRFFADRMGTVLPATVVRELMGSIRTPRGETAGQVEKDLERAYLAGEPVMTLHRTHRKESLSRKVAELERTVRFLRERVEERDRKSAPLDSGTVEIGEDG